MRSSDEQRERPWWRPSWYELLPEVVLTAGLALFVIDETDAATSAFKSPRAIGIMVAAALAWIVGRVALARYCPWRAARTALFAVAAAGALAVVVLPAYNDKTVVEAFPGPPATDASEESTASMSATTAPATGVPTDMAAGESTFTSSPPPTTAASSTPTPTTTAVATAPVRLRSASFVGIDHRASGTVSIYGTSEGRHVVGLESFDIQPGPDYDVYVVAGSDRDDRDGGIRLDDLRGNQGTQYYEVPVDVNVGQGAWTVLIWCQTFGVPVANATPV
jgi:Electron transfer DM13